MGVFLYLRTQSGEEFFFRFFFLFLQYDDICNRKKKSILNSSYITITTIGTVSKSANKSRRDKEMQLRSSITFMDKIQRCIW